MYCLGGQSLWRERLQGGRYELGAHIRQGIPTTPWSDGRSILAGTQDRRSQFLPQSFHTTAATPVSLLPKGARYTFRLSGASGLAQSDACDTMSEYWRSRISHAKHATFLKISGLAATGVRLGAQANAIFSGRRLARPTWLRPISRCKSDRLPSSLRPIASSSTPSGTTAPRPDRCCG